MIPAEELAGLQAAITAQLPDRADILSVGQTASTTQPGRRTAGETVRATAVPCSVSSAQARAVNQGGQVVTGVQLTVRLPALTPIAPTDRVRVTSTATGVVTTYEVQDILRRSGELTRLVLLKGVAGGTPL